MNAFSAVCLHEHFLLGRLKNAKINYYKEYVQNMGIISFAMTFYSFLAKKTDLPEYKVV